MKIFYIKINDNDYENLDRSELKKLQSELGHKLVDYVGKTVYKIENRAIIIENNKPKFKFSDIQFNISHSNQYVITAFDNYPIGIDLEYMKDRNFKEISRHYNIGTDNKIEFYKKWTQLEANIKIQTNPQQTYTEKFEADYMLTIVSANPEKIEPEFILIEQALVL